MLLALGTRKIKHKRVLFLADIKNFTDRKIFIFENPTNNKIHIVLQETSTQTKDVFEQRISGFNALEVLKREKERVLYTSDEIKLSKGKPFGWVYGENKEVHNKKGEVISIKQNACDFLGQKETINVKFLKQS